MEKEQIKRKLVVALSLAVVLILVITGISYAAFRFVGQGNKVNQITTGTIRMNYEEGTNVIRLNNALPTMIEVSTKRIAENIYINQMFENC